MIKNNYDTVESIRQRILDERRKHPDLDWAQIAATKIFSTYKEYFNGLNLKHVKAYMLTAPISERSYEKLGYYESEYLAEKDSEGAGWYNTKGTVTECDDVYIDSEENIYKVTNVGKFKDNGIDILEEIKSKLTDEEIKLLGI